ncbi:cation-translocating P-type ATPase [Undibacterium sp. TS12]|uniref:heavy metal translocating P-type ATPase n=1 Tax=Undibacterium sp. TS12 TaxID=2908202 RepID=UPI001F4C8FAB|nr:cation-translocating P-type ATPase [Undibacterium sp. TS12]MCH8619330.1 cation-translocating P-type ATPase [Undibacterium sp. TS12]
MSDKITCCSTHNHKSDDTHDHHHGHGHAHGAHVHKHEHHHAPAVAVPVLPAHADKLRLKIEQMDCPTEEALIRKAISTQAGVLALEFDLLNRVLTVHHKEAEVTEIHRRLAATGMAGTVMDDARSIEPKALTHATSVWQRYWRVALGGVAAVAAELLAWYSGDENSMAIAILALVAISSSGIPTLKKGWIALRHLTLNIHLLMTAAVIGATAIGQWPEAAMVIWLFAIAELIEAASLSRARDVINGLRSQAPETTLLQQTGGSWQMVETHTVEPGQIIQIRPGDRIALDGQIEAGTSSINEAAITGESMPVEKTTGDQVYAGSLNQSGLIQVKVTAGQASTMLARIAQSVQEAQGQRAPTQRFVDQFSAIYTPVVFIIALLVAVLPPILLHQDWHDSLYRALVLLVIACPCALVISTPVTVVSGLALAARRGIVIKGGVYLEQARHLKIIAFDKTGTLTEGKPQLTDIISLTGQSKEELLSIAASLDAHSSHPLAIALVQACKTPQVTASDVQLYEEGRGRGISGRLGTTLYQLGNQAMWENLQTQSEKQGLVEALGINLASLEAQARTVLFLCQDGRLLGLLALADKLREHSSTAMAQLHVLGIKTVMLTGDNAQTAATIASQAGIREFRSQLLPTEKLEAIRQYSTEGLTGMCGDGINDAPALARADIGFAMAAGSDTALETADVAFMQDDLRKLPEMIGISRRTSQVLLQNISFALLVKFVFFGLALTGHASLWMAVFADAGTSVLVVLNGLRLLQSKTTGV